MIKPELHKFYKVYTTIGNKVRILFITNVTISDNPNNVFMDVLYTMTNEGLRMYKGAVDKVFSTNIQTHTFSHYELIDKPHGDSIKKMVDNIKKSGEYKQIATNELIKLI